MAAIRRAHALRVAASRATAQALRAAASRAFATAPPHYDPASFSFLEPQRIRRRGLGVVHDPSVAHALGPCAYWQQHRPSSRLTPPPPASPLTPLSPSRTPPVLPAGATRARASRCPSATACASAAWCRRARCRWRCRWKRCCWPRTPRPRRWRSTPSCLSCRTATRRCTFACSLTTWRRWRPSSTRPQWAWPAKSLAASFGARAACTLAARTRACWAPCATTGRTTTWRSLSSLTARASWAWVRGCGAKASRSRSRVRAHTHAHTFSAPLAPPPRRRPGRQWHGHPHWQAGAVRGGGRH